MASIFAKPKVLMIPRLARRKPKPLKMSRSVQVTLKGKGPGVKKMNGYYHFYSGATKSSLPAMKSLATVGGRFTVKVETLDKSYERIRGEKVEYAIYRRRK